jgi:hypothetical protein
MAQAFETCILLDDETWEMFQYKAKNYNYDKHFPPKWLGRLRERAKELGMPTRFYSFFYELQMYQRFSIQLPSRRLDHRYSRFSQKWRCIKKSISFFFVNNQNRDD